MPELDGGKARLKAGTPVIPNFHFFTAGQCSFITSTLHRPKASLGRHHGMV